MKTEIEIERDFYTLIKNSTLGTSIRGTVYRSEMRPKDADSEDLIVKFLAGVDEQIQSGTMILNLYVPDTSIDGGRKVADKNRIGELQRLILDFIEQFNNTEYWIKTDGTPYSTYNPDIEQHLIVTRLKFQRLSD